MLLAWIRFMAWSGLISGALPHLTLLGDARLLLPASVALFVGLRVRADPRVSAAWLVAVVTCLALTVAAKLVFYKCGWWVGAYRLSSPSGHASLGTTFFGSVLLLLVRGKRFPASLLPILGVTSLVALIGYSRVALVKHTIPEVVVGCAIGLGCVALFWHLWTRSRLPLAPPKTMALVLGVLCGGVVLLGLRSGAEPVIRSIAFSHNLSTGICSVVPLPR
jgi:membrane-associated phospholipid phosphatase